MIFKLLKKPAVFQWQQRIFNSYENVRSEFADYLKSGPVNILDVGCSTGICGQTVFDMGRDNYTGVDIDPEYIEFARKSYPHGKYLVMDGRKLDFPDNTFDVVSFIGVVHHMDDDLIIACLSEVKRVMRQNAYLLWAEPVLSPNDLRSNFFLSMDRGKYIRESAQYLELLSHFDIVRTRFFRLSFHRFLSVVARPGKAEK